MVAARRGGVVAAVCLLATDGARVKIQKRGPMCGVKGESAPSTQIVNGQDATPCEWRWQAQLTRDRPFCGGTLISPEWVLTAAHCVSRPDFEVRLGDYNKTTEGGTLQTRKAVEVQQHPGYRTNPTRNDFAMVRLEAPVTINDCVGVACLPSLGSDLQPGTKCWITGWGTLSSGGTSPEILQEAEVTIVSNDDCVNLFSYRTTDIDDSMICAQGRTADGRVTDACQGDSGGPLVCGQAGRWTVYGATSWGRGCAGENFPGVWARVHQELGWIEHILAGNVPTPAPPTTLAPGTCNPDWSFGPDVDGDCTCNSGLRCFKDGDYGRCPWSFGTSSRFFSPSCTTCVCKDPW